MIKLDELLKLDGVVLIDGSIQGSSGFTNYLFEITSFDALDEETLESEVTRNNDFLRVLRAPLTKTISGVDKEIRAYSEIIGESMRSFRRNVNGGWRFSIKNKKAMAKRVRKNEGSCSRKERLLEEIQEQAFEAYRVARDKCLKFDGNRYRLLADMIKFIGQNWKLKKDNNKNGKYSGVCPDANERLTSALYCMCMDSVKNPSLFTRDRDFINLLGVTPWIMGADNFLPYNEEFRKSLIENPFRLYLKRGEEICDLTMDETAELSKYELLPSHEFNETKEILLDMWKRII